MTNISDLSKVTSDAVSPHPTACMVCGAGHDQQFIVYEKWGYGIQKCRVCGLGRTLLDRDADVMSIYDEGYFQGKRRDGYADYVGSEQVLRQEFRHSLEALRQYGNKEGRLLEIGSAYGFFLAEAAAYFECMGIEVSEAAVEFSRSRGFQVDCGTLTPSFIAAQDAFDAVVMLDVIEHLPDPAETLDLIWQSLKMGGSLMISTGDWDSLLAQLMGKRWRLMTPPQHLTFFSVRTLTRLLESSGFEVVHLVKPWKTVAVGLIAYQLGSRAGLRVSRLEAVNVGVPVNLFDAMRLVARKVDR